MVARSTLACQAKAGESWIVVVSALAMIFTQILPLHRKHTLQKCSTATGLSLD